MGAEHATTLSTKNDRVWNVSAVEVEKSHLWVFKLDPHSQHPSQFDMFSSV